MAAARFRRRLRYAIGVALLLSVAVFALAWVAGTEPALQWLARQMESRTGGALTFENPRGSLYGPLESSRIVWEDRARRIEAQGVRIDWSPSALLAGRLVVTYLDVSRLDVLTKISDEAAPRPPAALETPIVVSLARARFGEVVVRTDANRSTLRDVEFSARLGRQQHELGEVRAQTKWGVLQADATLAARPPLRLTGHAMLTGDSAPDKYRMEVRAAGTLRDIGISYTAELGSARARGEARIAPFSEAWLAAAEIDADGIDPARLREGLLSADIGARLRVRGGVKGHFSGSVSLNNAEAGTLDARRIPAEALSFAFSGDAHEMAIDEVVLNLGRAGAFAGNGKLRGERIELALATRRFDLRGIEHSLRTTRLAGTVRLGLAESGQTLVADFAQPGFDIRLDAALEAGRLRLNQARARSGKSMLALTGALALDAPRAFDAQATLSQVNLAEFGDFPSSAIHGVIRLRGDLMPRPVGDVELDIRDSRIRGYPLSATGKARVSADRIDRAALDFVIAGNQLALNGSYGGPGDRIDWVLAAPRLGRIADGMAGSVTGKGSLQGTISAPAVTFRLAGRDLRLPGGHQISLLAGDGNLARGLEGTLALDARVRGVRSGKWALDEVRLTASGSRDHHLIRIAARGAGIDLRAVAEGGWHDDRGWRGQLVNLEQHGRVAVRLEEPARIAMGGERFLLEHANLLVGDARVRITRVGRERAASDFRGEFSGLPLAILGRVIELPEQIQSTLVLGGKWNFARDAGTPWHGDMELARESGDLVVTHDAPVALGLTQLRVSARARDGRVALEAALAGARSGTLEVTARIPVLAGMLPVPDRGAPLDAMLRAEMPNIAWLASLSRQAVNLKGAIHANLAAGGTLDAPRLTGSVTGEGLAIHSAGQGVNLTDGRFVAELAGSEMRVKTFRFNAGGGHVEASGRLGLAGGDPDIALDWKAAQLEAIRLPDRHVVVSGGGRLELRARRLWLSGKLGADRGLVELAERTGVTLSDDVVIRGRAVPAQTPQPLLARLDLEFDLGKRFFLKGLGLDARLAGRVRVKAESDQLPTAAGSIRVAQGNYRAYGQQLAIERGILSFSGPIDNPGLDVIALRKNQKVEAGVAVTGTASAPLVKLVSRPDVPDNEKLSWLVLGRGPDTAGRGDAALLQAAAGALLSQGESASLQGQIAEAANLDEFGFRTGGTVQSSVMTLGKRLSSNVYLAYEQGLFAAASVVKLRYSLTPALTLQTQAGTDNAVDLFYNIFFD